LPDQLFVVHNPGTKISWTYYIDLMVEMGMDLTGEYYEGLNTYEI